LKIKGAIMPSTATLKVKIDPELKKEAEKKFKNWD